MPGYRLYSDIVRRLGDCRASGDGLTFRCPFPDRHRHGDRNWSCRFWVGHDGRAMARCLGCGASWAEIVGWVGLPADQWFPDRHTRGGGRMSDGPKPKLVATYDYRDAGGVLLFQKLRYEPKTFRTRMPLPARIQRRANDPTCIPPDADSWVWGITPGEYGRASTPGKWDFYPVRDGHQHSISLTADDCPEPPLYRLPELLAADPRQPVFVVEGERDADLLRGLGFVSVCGHAGSSQWGSHWSAVLAGRRVVVVPDDNDVGYAHAARVFGWLALFGAASVRMLGWDRHEPGPGGGVGNWLDPMPAADRKAAVVGLCKAYPEWTPTVVARPPATGTQTREAA